MRPRTYHRREPSNTLRWRRDRCGAFPALHPKVRAGRPRGGHVAV